MGLGYADASSGSNQGYITCLGGCLKRELDSEESSWGFTVAINRSDGEPWDSMGEI